MIWSHKAHGPYDHEADPKYNGSGWFGGGSLVYWVCHRCRYELLLDGRGVPITVPVARREPLPAGGKAPSP